MATNLALNPELLERTFKGCSFSRREHAVNP
jgi:hypothetical protein